MNAPCATLDRKLGIEANRVLKYLTDKANSVDTEGYLLISQTAITRELAMKQPSVHRALTRLILAKRVERFPLRCGLYRAYRLTKESTATKTQGTEL